MNDQGDTEVLVKTEQNVSFFAASTVIKLKKK